MIEMIVRSLMPAALSVLPEEMNSPAARAMLLAIALQESRFLHRRQADYGPARGFWQFEKNAVRGVSGHHASKAALEEALRVLRYETLIGQMNNLHYAIEDNDVLACVFARLLLWTVPGRLPTIDEPEFAYAQYIDGWRPGKPRPETWRGFYDEAWGLVAVADKGAQHDSE